MTVTNIAARKTEVDPLRAQLADAIKSAATAQDAVAAAEEALERGRQIVFDAEAAVEAATAAVGKAREQDARAATKAIKARAGAGTPEASRKARAELAAAQDSAEVALSCIENLEEELRQAEDAAAWRVNDVTRARNAVLASIATEILEQGRAARLTAVIAENVLAELLHGHDKRPDFSDTLDSLSAAEQRESPLLMIKKEATYFVGVVGVSDGERAAIDQAVAAVREFIATLEIDPATELPGVLE